MKMLDFLKDPQQDYFIYLSGIITHDESYKQKFFNAENLIMRDYKFIFILNPVTLCEKHLSPDQRTWENCMQLDTLILNMLDKMQTIFLRIDSVEKARKVKSGMLIEN